MRRLNARRTIGAVVASSLVFFVIVATLCPLPSLVMAEAPALGGAASGPMECPFHPGRAASLSTALQYSLDTFKVIPGAQGPVVASDCGDAAFLSAIPRHVDYAAPQGPVPTHVPLFLLHASLIR
ncbi:MAG TPA: hypothetical protein VFN94_09935 [Nitrospiria bacterium]|nr:hypothetical protein [Nitrospiria bacterium]